MCVQTLSKPVDGWPVVLSKRLEPVESAPGTSGTTDKSSKKQSAKSKSSGNQTGAGTGWLHGELTRRAADKLLQPKTSDDGKFLVRTKKGEYILSVVHQNKGTHHNISKNVDGFFTVYHF